MEKLLKELLEDLNTILALVDGGIIDGATGEILEKY